MHLKVYWLFSKKQTASDCRPIITTKEFDTNTKAEAFGTTISHTASHAGQMSIILKYGSA
jgi:hypothetical protein